MVCKTECTFMTLDVNGFSQLISQYKRYVIDQKVRFLQQYVFFSQIPESSLLQIYDLTISMVYPGGNMIYKEGDPVKYIYFIRSGEVEISQLIQVEDLRPSEFKKIDQ